MIQKVKFRGRHYRLIFTQHALERMLERKVSRSLVKIVIESGDSVEKKKKGKWWAFKKVKERKDNFVCLSISIESPNLIVITTLVNWRPKT